MSKKLNNLLNIIIGTAIGVFLGHSAYLVWDYKTHPSLYAMQSAPWYTSILVYGGFTLAVLFVSILVKVIIRRKTK